MLNNFIYAQTKELFLNALENHQILDEAIVFIEDTKEIWNHGHYFAGESIDPIVFAQLQTVVADLKEKSEKSIIFLDESRITLPFGYVGADSQKYTCVPGLNDCGQIDGYYYGSVVIYLKVSSGTIFEERKISELTSSNAIRLNGGMIVVYAQNNHLFVENNAGGNFDIYFKGFHSYQTLPECFIPETVIRAITPITYSELKSLRDNSQLIPGRQYRITDYVTTTTQENTKSALHPFDIIVTADDEKTLNEEARACIHEGDTYFTENGANLSAWKIWYCLDNDVERFAWANASETSEELLLDTIKPESGVDASGTYTYNVPISKIEFRNNTYVPAIGIRTMINSGPPVYITKTDTQTLVVEDSADYIAITGISIYGIPQPGKGVIYRMIDEWNNDCPYDFKNIQFARWWWSKPVWYMNDYDFNNHESNWVEDRYIDRNYSRLGEGPYGLNSQDKKIEFGAAAGGYTYKKYKVEYTIATSPTYCYTFSEGISYSETSDLSLNNILFNNIIKECSDKKLNNIVFVDFDLEVCNSNTFGYNCCNNTFLGSCYNNTFGNSCSDNVFSGKCRDNTFGNSCSDNVFSEACYNNTFGNSCSKNIFGANCRDNTFGNSCSDNVFGNSGRSNTCGNDFDSNTFGIYVSYNTFGNNCSYNTFGENCSYNTFGENCGSNTFSEYCSNNTFGVNCHDNSFRESASEESSLKQYCAYNHFDDGCSYNVIWNSDTTSSSDKLQNININRGVSGKYSNYNFINIDTLNAGYEIQVAKNSNGRIVTYCEADLIA